VKEAGRIGITIMDQVMVIDLIKDKNIVVGAVTLEMETDTLLFIQAKSVILATGGAGNLYSLTTNPPGVTGDGYASLQGRRRVGRYGIRSDQGVHDFSSRNAGNPPPGDGLVTLGGDLQRSCEALYGKYHPDN
jgi:glycerol-3-phosphate dehydrogenase